MKSFLFTDEVAKRIAREPKEKSALPSLLELSARKNLIPDTAMTVLYATLDACQSKIGAELLSHLPSPDDVKKTYSACQFIEDDSDHYFPKLLRLFAMKLDFSAHEVVDYFDKLVNNFAFEERSLISDAGLVYQFISNSSVSSQNIDSLVTSLKTYYDEISVNQFLSLSLDYSYKTPALLNKLKETRSYSGLVNVFLSEEAPSSKRLQNPFLNISDRINESYKLIDDSDGLYKEITALSWLTSSYLSKSDIAFYLKWVADKSCDNLDVFGHAVKDLIGKIGMPDEYLDLISSATSYSNASEQKKIDFVVDLIDESMECRTQCPMNIASEALKLLALCTTSNDITSDSFAKDEFCDLAERALLAIDGASYYWDAYPDNQLLEDYKKISSLIGDESSYDSFIDAICFLKESGPTFAKNHNSDIDYCIISKYAERYGISAEFIDNHKQDEKLGAFALGVLLLSNLPRAYITGDANELESAVENGVKLLPHLKHAISSYINDLDLYRPLQFMLKEIHERHGDNITIDNQTYSLSNILDELVNDLSDDSRYINVQQDYISFLLKSKVESTPSVKLQLGARPTL